MISVFSYHAIYILLAVITIIAAYSKSDVVFINTSENKVAIINIILVVITISTIAALRPFESADTANYFSVYISAKEPALYFKDFLIYGKRIHGIETSFVFLFSVLKSLSFSFRQVLFIIAFVNSALILTIAIKISQLLSKKPDISKIVALFVSYFGLHYCCIAIRAGLSLGIGMLAVYLLLTRRRAIGIVALYGSILVHSMSVLFIPIIIYLCFNNSANYEQCEDSQLPLITIMICFLSLTFNLGSKIVDAFIHLFEFMSDYFGINSFAGYMVGLDRAVGVKDWFIAIAIGLTMLSVTQSTRLVKKSVVIVLLGLVITSFLYPVRAINRAADYCFLMCLPLIGTFISKEYFPKGKVFAEYIIYPMLLAVQFNL